MQFIQILTIVVAVAACERADGVPGAKGSAVGSNSDAAAIDAIVTDTLAYAGKLPPILLAFEGDCGKQADRLLVLEPLVKTIRDRTALLVRDDPTAHDKIVARLHEREKDMMATYEAELAATGHTRAQVEQQEAAMKEACKDDARLQDAIDRIGVFKKHRQ